MSRSFYFGSRPYTPPARLHWAAFFGDVEHSVDPVTSGYRVTLTYTLYHENMSGSDGLLARTASCQRQLEALLRDPSFFPEGGHIGYFCKHLYEETQLAAVEKKLATDHKKGVYVSQLRLKNEDAVVGVVLDNCRLSTTCLRLMTFEWADEPYVLTRMPKKKDAGQIARRVRIENAFTALGVDLEDLDSSELVEGRLSDLYEDVHWIGTHSSDKKLWASMWSSPTGYFGNEASQTDFYTYAAVMAEVPPYEERKDKFAPFELVPRQVGALTPKAVEGKKASKKGASGKQSGDSAAGTSSKQGAAATPAVGKKRKAEAMEASTSGAKQEQPSKRARTGAEGSEVAANDNASGSDGEGSEEASTSAAPPQLFRQEARGASAADRLQTVRTIKVIGGRGGLANRRKEGGNATVTLQPGAGLRELKASLRKVFGKVPSAKMSALHVVNEDGTIGGPVKSNQIKDGMTLSCTYTYAPGNPAALGRGGWGRRAPAHCIHQ
eukprot:TRINITY_DN4077_c0_g1_i1.p1 TRINITY_DN4077_c0_g1~~TRINITY_DN4077_c0_g1_i1.p1  ORF type:complete len:494 (+),score=106.67 TRINITY_DN4077_c0_g1_i1:853-2334(+)